MRLNGLRDRPARWKLIEYTESNRMETEDGSAQKLLRQRSTREENNDEKRRKVDAESSSTGSGSGQESEEDEQL